MGSAIMRGSVLNLLLLLLCTVWQGASALNLGCITQTDCSKASQASPLFAAQAKRAS